jgi:hypothetical protein
MCQGNNFDTTTGLVHNVPRLHVGDCKGFNGPHFAIPKVGDRLKVIGLYVQIFMKVDIQKFIQFII